MPKPKQKNNYREFLKKKRKFDKKVKQGKIFKDTDHDGLSDYEEKYLYGTDPKNPDTDRDGMKDGAEVKRGRNPLGKGTLKDLFIPHAGNNYKPHALKPKRLLFHAAGVVAIKAIVVAFILIYPISAWLSPDMALAEAKKIIELTNNLRKAISLPALLESEKLNQAAYGKVEDMALNQYFAHTSPAGLSLKDWLKKINYQYAVAGENLAVGFSRAEDVVLAWKNSPTHYSNIIDGDFKEIGVAMADGKLNQIDTAFIAQYFAAPATVANLPSEPITPKLIQPEVNQPAGNSEVQGEKVNLTPAPAAINQQTTILSIKADPLNNEKAIQIKTILPEDTVSAEIIVDNKKIALNKESSQANIWNGAALISAAEEKNILNPLVPASLTATNSSGAAGYGKVDWDDVKIIKTTPLEHYQLYKNNPAAAMAPVMSLSNLYFKLILALALIALILNIFIEIKKQHPHIIAYSLAFLSLLMAMIIF
ncbi:MAG: CAP domain-containing protein [Patescibacteria group bacterium]|nr:CAP domain-containing protein [Patescibacteria group bacterium]